MHRFANNEAALSYINGLNLMADLPASEERNRQELAFRLALGPALLAARGYASDEVEHNVSASLFAYYGTSPVIPPNR